DRIQAVGAGIVFNTPMQAWSTDVKRPQCWLRTDAPGLVQYVGAGGDERDVRVWAWLAFLRPALVIQWSSALPRTSSATDFADPAYALMTGTADPAAWSDGLRLLAKVILLREPGQIADKDKADALALEVLHWSRPQDAALLMARTADWGFTPGNNQWLTLTTGLDIYNASDTKPDQNRLQWTSVPRGWEVQPQPAALAAL